LKPAVTANASEGGGTGFGYSVVLLARAAANADGAHDSAVTLQGNAPGKDHHPATET
jgi:hypothetical protein